MRQELIEKLISISLDEDTDWAKAYIEDKKKNMYAKASWYKMMGKGKTSADGNTITFKDGNKLVYNETTHEWEYEAKKLKFDPKKYK